MASLTIAVIGALNTDLITVTSRLPDSGETLISDSFSTHPGGKGANAAVAAYRSSHPNPKNAHASAGQSYSVQYDPDIKVLMTGAVGKDPYGEQLIETLKANNVDVQGIRKVEDETTGTAVVIVESDFGENRIMYHPGANHTLQPSHFLTWESLAGGRRPDLVIAQLELHRETVEQILETASIANVDVLLNPAPARWFLHKYYKTIKHLILNETEAAMLTDHEVEDLKEEASQRLVAEEFLTKGAENVVITLGANGAYYANKDGDRGHVEAEKGVTVVDTTGAGDTFVGAYGVAYLRQKHSGEKWDLKAAVQFACRASARTIEHIGALETIPWADEMEGTFREGD